MDIEESMPDQGNVAVNEPLYTLVKESVTILFSKFNVSNEYIEIN